jgi:hypothetical protein
MSYCFVYFTAGDGKKDKKEDIDEKMETEKSGK